MQATQAVSINRWMDKKNVAYPYTEIPLSNKKNILTHATTQINPEDIMLKWAKPVTKRQIVYDSSYNEVPRVVKFIQTESSMVVAKGWGRRVLGS